MRLAWLTDVHFDFLRVPQAIEAFGGYIKEETACDVALITGDIAVASSLVESLKLFQKGIKTKVYFVLGNHDYYGSSFREVHLEVKRAFPQGGNIVWLTHAGVTKLTDTYALVGHDGFFDAQFGNPMGTDVQLSDFELIEELGNLHSMARMFYLRELGEKLAKRALVDLEAITGFKQVLFATHYPPFKEACWHEGALSDVNWLPYFTCKAMGDVLVRMAYSNEDMNFQVLCGHTHGSGEVVLLPNLTVYTGGARYGFPDVAKVFELE